MRLPKSHFSPYWKAERYDGGSGRLVPIFKYSTAIGFFKIRTQGASSFYLVHLLCLYPSKRKSLQADTAILGALYFTTLWSHATMISSQKVLGLA
jgi:hypothetical protein